MNIDDNDTMLLMGFLKRIAEQLFDHPKVAMQDLKSSMTFAKVADFNLNENEIFNDEIRAKVGDDNPIKYLYFLIRENILVLCFIDLDDNELSPPVYLLREKLPMGGFEFVLSHNCHVDQAWEKYPPSQFVISPQFANSLR